MKNVFPSALFLFLSAGSLTLVSCQKEDLKDPSLASVKSTNVNAVTKNSSGGGGDSGSGHNGGSSGGGGTTTTSDPSLAPTDTTTSQLPVQSIITTGRWKLTSFVQNNDNNTAQFANYAFTFNTDGSMVADNGSQTVGYWHYQEAVFYYGLPVYGSSPYGLTMTIGAGLPLTLLNENYFVSKKTLTTVSIDSVNPNENAHITFSKLAQ